MDLIWMNISEGIPPMGMPLMVEVDRRGICAGSPFVILGPVYYLKAPTDGNWGFYEYADLERRIGPEYAVVVKWALWPTPDGETDEEEVDDLAEGET